MAFVPLPPGYIPDNASPGERFLQELFYKPNFDQVGDLSSPDAFNNPVVAEIYAHAGLNPTQARTALQMAQQNWRNTGRRQTGAEIDAMFNQIKGTPPPATSTPASTTNPPAAPTPASTYQAGAFGRSFTPGRWETLDEQGPGSTSESLIGDFNSQGNGRLNTVFGDVLRDIGGRRYAIGALGKASGALGADDSASQATASLFDQAAQGNSTGLRGLGRQYLTGLLANLRNGTPSSEASNFNNLRVTDQEQLIEDALMGDTAAPLRSGLRSRLRQLASEYSGLGAAGTSGTGSFAEFLNSRGVF